MARTRFIEETDLERYIKKNRDTCRVCGERIFWASTSTGKRIPMDFPNTIMGDTPTHELVLGYGKEGWDGTLEAWPSEHKPTHACHLDTCKGDPKENLAKEVADWEARRKAETDAAIERGWS